MEKYRHRVGELQGIIEQLEAKLKQLSESFENTVQPLREATTVAESEIRRQKIKAVIWAIIAAIGGGLAGYLAGRIL